MSPSPPWVPFDETRAHRVILIAAALVLGAVLWAILCLLPVIQWNAARLAPSFALSRGLPFYALRDSGAQLGWFYGPGFPLWYLPVTIFDSPTYAHVAAGILNLVTWLLPIAWVLRAAGASRRAAATGTLLAAIFMLGNPLLQSVFSYVHVDGVAIALQLVACLGLLHATRHPARFGVHVAALALAAAFWTKLIAIALAPALFCWLWQEKRRDLISPLVFWCVAYGGVMSALVLAAFGPAEVLFNVWFYHAKNQWKSGGVALVASSLWELAISTWHWWPAALLAYWLKRSVPPDQAPTGMDQAAGRVRRLLLWCALWLAPGGLMAALKSGGGLHSVYSLHYVLLAGLLVLVGRMGRPTRQLVTSTVLFGLTLAFQLVDISEIAATSLAVRPTPDRCQEELLEMAVKNPGRYYFPWNPMITIIAERRISPSDDALYWLHAVNLEPPLESIHAAVPKNAVIVYLEPAQSHFALRYFRLERPNIPAPPVAPKK